MTHRRSDEFDEPADLPDKVYRRAWAGIFWAMLGLADLRGALEAGANVFRPVPPRRWSTGVPLLQDPRVEPDPVNGWHPPDKARL